MRKLDTMEWLAVAAVVVNVALVTPALAATSMPAQGIRGAQNEWVGNGGERGGMNSGIFGTVSAISGNTLTVTSGARPVRPVPMHGSTTTAVAAAPTVYTVDASNAKIYKGSATTTVSVSSIATGDTVMVEGTISGANVAATVIRDGVGLVPGKGPGMPGKGSGDHGASSTMPRPSGTPIIAGNGEPVVGGSVTAISGNTLTVTNASNVTYTIDVSSAKIVKGSATSTISAIAVGDNVIVQGVVNGTAITASSVIDGAKLGSGSSTGTSPSDSHEGGGFGGAIGGFFGGIGGFFKHLFGF
jgi:hypothetical protein